MTVTGARARGGLRSSTISRAQSAPEAFQIVELTELSEMPVDDSDFADQSQFAPGDRVVGEHFGHGSAGTVVRLARGQLREALVEWPDGWRTWKRYEHLERPRGES
jgi:hypothetical protein